VETTRAGWQERRTTEVRQAQIVDAAPKPRKEIEMKATKDLIAEHNAVLVALQILEKIEDGLAAGAAAAPEHLDQRIDFFGWFVDRRHHAKEEDVLFPHIDKENNVLFPMADRLLPDDDAAKMIVRFEEIERDRVGPGKHEAYHDLMRSAQ
jgi:hemerythrin-like domain-containing protein